MKIAVLSGKGGTGKTTVATNLAALLGASYIDCDVEAPNGFLFLQPEQIHTTPVEVENPLINQAACLQCGHCVQTCQFYAFAQLPKEILFFPQLCHSCGACQIACPHDAIRMISRTIGQIDEGESSNGQCKRGVLNIGEPFAVPIISRLLSELPEGLHILDAPPGTSCDVVRVLHYADAAIIVVEPTPFGVHDFKMALQLVQDLQLPVAVIINKGDEGTGELVQWCKAKKLPVLGLLPYSKEAAATYAEGQLLLTLASYQEKFAEIAATMQEGLGWN